MGASKTEDYSERILEAAKLAKAMAHPARISIVEYLLKIDGCVCNDIVDALPLSQPTVSQHLKELKAAGIIKGSIDKNSICYCLEPKAIQKLQFFFSGILTKLDKKNSES